MINILEDTDEFRSYLSRNEYVLVDFFADWCEPCRWLEPVLEEIVSRISVPLEILKVNTDKHISLTHEFGLKSVPVLILFRNGELIWRMNGFLPAPELVTKLEMLYRTG